MAIKISLFYAGMLGLLLTALSFNVMYHWVRVTGKGRESDLVMRRAERVLASFVEYAPMTIILLALIELRGAPVFAVHLLGALAVVARVLHAVGSNQIKGAGLMRFMGAQLTFLVVMVLSFACIYLFIFGPTTI